MRDDVATRDFEAGRDLVAAHPLFRRLLGAAYVVHAAPDRMPLVGYPPDGLCWVTSAGSIVCHPTRRAEPTQWARALAHCLLHLGLGHFRHHDNPVLWNMACDCAVEQFLTELRFGTSLSADALPEGVRDEERLYQRLLHGGDKGEYAGFGTAGTLASDMVFVHEQDGWPHWGKPPQWDQLFSAGLAAAVRSAVEVASGQLSDVSSREQMNSAAQRAKEWFISSYPLLGAVAAAFRLVEDPLVCQREGITVAAISPALAEIYVNPAATLDESETRFVMAHEFLHAALRHDARQEWRDGYLWNVACDYVINQWLTEMGVGERPDGLLYDAQFKGLGAEEIYDRIVTDMRRFRKLATLRGVGVVDVLPGQMRPSPDVDLDAFYRQALSQGLSYHQEQGRGYLPAGLVEEIRSLSHPPIPWDVELARWFNEHFTPVEKTRSFARASRRQSSTPDIPRPSWSISEQLLDGRTFGVILDTSGSMERGLLASALGAIASYASARDVPAARVVFCDAEAYDMGYLKPDDVAGTVKVRGRGGTILQPGVDLLEQADDFPDDAPILIITDGYCDKVALRGREHAFLIPRGATLPFVPKGPVFRMK